MCLGVEPAPNKDPEQSYKRNAQLVDKDIVKTKCNPKNKPSGGQHESTKEHEHSAKEQVNREKPAQSSPPT